MKIEQKYFIGVQDIGPDNRITNRALVDALSNTATLHATSVGQGIDDMYTKHLTWVAMNWKVQVLHRCGACEWITVRTWAQDYNRLKAVRNYEVLDGNGEIMAYASSVWTAIDPDSTVSMNMWGFSEAVLGELQARFTAFLGSMIDCNHHVHNTAYLDLAREALPEEEDQVSFDNLEITYRREIKPEEELEIRCGSVDGVWYVGIYSVDDQLHSVLKMYRK